MQNMHNDSNAKYQGSPLGLHIVAKPIGPMCDLDCEYCIRNMGPEGNLE
jgi:sulfatase maturation enzyme AslB (radical SAM superfamily)